MKNILISAVAISSLAIAGCNDEKAVDVSKLEQNEKYSYAFGKGMAEQALAMIEFYQNELDFELSSEFIKKGMQDSFNQVGTLSQEDWQQIMHDLNAEVEKLSSTKMEEQAAELEAEITKSRSEQDAFFIENKDKEGVKTTESGLQYEIIKQGEGRNATESDKIKVHYIGTLINESQTEFDNSYTRNEPAEFKLSQVVQGWQEGLTYMNAGSKFILYVPSDLAYGDTGIPSSIPPATALKFEIELISIEDDADKSDLETSAK